MPHKINQTQYNKLTDIRVMMNDLNKRQQALESQAIDITKEEDVSGYTFDYVYNGIHTVDELLENLNITVEE